MHKNKWGGGDNKFITHQTWIFSTKTWKMSGKCLKKESFYVFWKYCYQFFFCSFQGLIDSSCISLLTASRSATRRNALQLVSHPQHRVLCSTTTCFKRSASWTGKRAVWNYMYFFVSHRGFHITSKTLKWLVWYRNILLGC